MANQAINASNRKIYQYCSKIYNTNFTTFYTQLYNQAINTARRGLLSKQKSESIEREAQSSAIKQTFLLGCSKFPNTVPDVWNAIYCAHLKRKSGITDPNVVDKVISAAQSWKSSSGHAFEALVVELANNALQSSGIHFMLPSQITELVNLNQLGNDPRDIAWLEKQITQENFDIYAVFLDTPAINKIGEIQQIYQCYGCIQCKTSIRDRVSRDRELSAEAMKAFFWSVAIVLDGTELKTPKYTDMVNGNPESTFVTNGWHVMFVLSNQVPVQRILPLSLDFSQLKSDAIKAKNDWIKKRQWFTNKWPDI